MLTQFQFECQEIRFVDEKPVANDVAKILGYSDPQSTISKKVASKNKGVAKMETPGGIQNITVLEEAGIYQLIFGSKLPNAEKFQDWVFDEVLPSIRKTGSYAIAEPIKPKTALELAKEQVKLLEQIEVQQLIIDEQEKDLLRQAEVIDELFDYSSILRIAIFNGVSEKLFSYHRLKAVSKMLKMEIKSVPCPRFVKKNLYSHDVWRYAYPEYKLPETTTLVISGN
jgi:prophage antirepressor-like protein